MKKTILVCLASIFVCAADAQTFFNNGAIVVVTQGAQMIVNSDGSTGSGSLENHTPNASSQAGTFKNKGQVTITGSFVNDNNSIADGFGTNTGQYIVKQDWENNGTFNADQSTVMLDGSTQEITGTNQTTFYNLICNTSGSAKTQTIDASVSNVLTLNQCELATAGNTMTILNTDTGAIVQNSSADAFVSSTGNGRLIRNTNQKLEYLFPTGVSNNGSPKIREVAIVPANSQARSYRVRYADDGAAGNTTTQDGYDTIKKGPGIGMVNGVYYHLITASDNAPGDLALFYDPAVDNNWASIGRWQTIPEWENLNGTVQLADPRGTGRIKITKPSWTPTTDTAFALVDTIKVKRDFNFPNAFVPGLAGVNGSFGIINQGNVVTLEELSVYNRWGEMVFNSKRDGTQSWDGHFRGKLQEQGNYVFLAIVKNNDTGKEYPTVTGNLSLLW